MRRPAPGARALGVPTVAVMRSSPHPCRVFARCKQYTIYLRESSSPLVATDPRIAVDEPPEPEPFAPEEFAAWRGMLRVHSSVFRELDRRLLAEHGFGIDSYGVMITL